MFMAFRRLLPFSRLDRDRVERDICDVGVGGIGNRGVKYNQKWRFWDIKESEFEKVL